MAFNPRTETVSYVIIAPFVAMCAGLLIRQQKSLTVLTALLVFLCIGFGADCYGDIYKLTRIWFKPLLALVFLDFLWFGVHSNTVLLTTGIRRLFKTCLILAFVLGAE